MSQDPIGFEGGLNLFGYVEQNPLNAFDPDGLAVETGWDVANVAMGTTSFVANMAAANWGGAALDLLGTGYDAFATATPGLPAGASNAIKANRARQWAQAANRLYDNSKLAKNMAAAGRGVAKATERAHHIVAHTHRHAIDARNRLRGLGIDIDDAVNGTALPAGFHNRMHTDEYFKVINDCSKKWNSREEAIAGLERIRIRLQHKATQWQGGAVPSGFFDSLKL